MHLKIKAGFSTLAHRIDAFFPRPFFLAKLIMINGINAIKAYSNS